MARLSAKRRVLMVGGEGIVLYSPSGKGVERETAIAWDVPNFSQQLIEVLSEKNKNKPVLVLFDGADQTYRKEENVPKLSPFDRPRFVKRKLELAFPSYAIRASLEIKPPKKKGRRATGTPSYLFTALPESDELTRVSEALFESGVPVAGFGNLPIESADLVTALQEKVFGKAAIPSKWAVLIGQHETGGLRQVVVKEGNLALARVPPTTEAGAGGAEWAEEVTRSFRETLAYISRLGYTPDDGLDIIIMCRDIEKQFFDAEALSATNFKCIGVMEALTLMGAKSFGFDKSNFSDAVHAAWASKKSSLRLPIRVPSIHRIMMPRLAARGAAVLLTFAVLGLMAWSGQMYTGYLSIKDELSIKINNQKSMTREYEEESKAFDDLPIPPQVIKNTLNIKELLEGNTVNPALFLHRLKDTLGADIKLLEFDYEHTPGPSLQLGQGGGSRGRRGLAPTYNPQQEGARGDIKVGFKFTLPAKMGLEQKVLRAEKMQADLEKAFPDHDVQLVQQFGRVSRGGAFEGGTGAEQSGPQQQKDVASFSIKGEPL